MVERGGAIVALLTGLLMLEKLQQELAGAAGECRYRRRRVRRDKQTKTEGRDKQFHFHRLPLLLKNYTSYMLMSSKRVMVNTL